MSPNAICIVAKSPIPGKSKTRLGLLASTSSSSSSSCCCSRNTACNTCKDEDTTAVTAGLTDEGCARMAKAMLCDVLVGIHHSTALSSVVKCLYHAPADDDGRKRMESILDELDIPYRRRGCSGDEHPEVQDGTAASPTTTATTTATWYLCPMPDAHKNNLRSSDLGSKLAGMLEQIRSMVQREFGHEDNGGTPSAPPAVAFLGMDSPELPIEEIAHALDLASGRFHHSTAATNSHNGGPAYINPSHDGGYGMLCLPPQAPPSVFEGVRWSDPLTAVSQMKALSDEGIAVTVGSLMRDIDEMEDLVGLAQRLRLARSRNCGEGSGEDNGKDIGNGDKLLGPPPGAGIDGTGPANDNICHYSWEAIQQLKIGH